MIRIKRAYEPEARDDGKRILIDRLWPRGIKKENLHIDEWLKDLAPSTELRKRFHHDPAKWGEFKREYFAELDAHPANWTELAADAKKETVTLIYSAKDEEHNDAVALKEYLEKKLK